MTLISDLNSVYANFKTNYTIFMFCMHAMRCLNTIRHQHDTYLSTPRFDHKLSGQMSSRLSL